jgi:hypothetical protein
MCRELGWDDSLQCAKHADPSNAGIRNRDSSQRSVLVRICRELASGFWLASSSILGFPLFWNGVRESKALRGADYSGKPSFRRRLYSVGGMHQLMDGC